jgi:hypothetical protein
MPSGQEPKVQQASTLSEDQHVVAGLLSNLIEEGLQKGITWPSFGVPETPREVGVAYKRFISEQDKWQDAIDQTLSDLIQGQPAFEFPFDKAAEFHQEFVATPAIESFKRNVQPVIEESFGEEFYNARRRKEVTSAITDVAAGLDRSLFETQMMGLQLTAESEENAADKQLTALAMAQSQPLLNFQQIASAAGTVRANEVADITAQLEDWARQQEFASPWLSQASSFLGRPHVENIAFQGSQSPWENPLTYAAIGSAAYGQPGRAGFLT